MYIFMLLLCTPICEPKPSLPQEHRIIVYLAPNGCCAHSATGTYICRNIVEFSLGTLAAVSLLQKERLESFGRAYDIGAWKSVC